MCIIIIKKLIVIIRGDFYNVNIFWYDNTIKVSISIIKYLYSLIIL